MGNTETKLTSSSHFEPPREFSLSNKKLKLDSVVDVEEYVQVLGKIKNLTVVFLNGNTIGVEAAKALAEALRPHKTLREVNLSDCFTGRLKEEVPVAMEAFCKVFLTLPMLLKVDFSDNAFGPVGAKAIYEYLSNAHVLQELRLNNNGLGPEGGKLVGEALCNLQQLNKTANRPSALRKITIGRNRLENGSAEILGRVFESHGNLEEISLYQNGIRPEGIVILAEAIAKCKALQYLDMQDNTFTETGSVVFAQSLKELTALAHLNFGECLLRPAGAKALFEALFSCPLASNLRFLNVQYNEINEKTALFIAENVSKFHSLQHLVLNGNDFKSMGPAAKAIKQGFESMERLEVLDEWDDMEADIESDESDKESGKEFEPDNELSAAVASLKIN